MKLSNPGGGLSLAAADARYVLSAGGAFTGLIGAGFRDTSADFDVSLVFTSAIPLDAGRTLTVDVGNANRALTLYGDFVVPDGGGTAALLGADNIFTGANEVHNAAGFVARPSILQDGVALKGRAGGTFSYTAAITTAALTASRSFTIPAVSADDTFALLGVANAFTAAQSISVNGAASTPPLALTGTIFTGGSATTTKPQLLIEPSGATSNTWSTNGTLIGANAPNSYGGDLFNFLVNGVSKVRSDGANIRFGGDFGLYQGSTVYLYLAGNNLGVAYSNVIKWNVDNGGSMGLSSGGDLSFSSTTASTASKDVGLARGSAGVGKITNGSSGYGTLDALAYRVSGTQVVGAQGAAVADASGGAIIDSEARTALNALLARVRTHGLIAT